MRTPTLRLFVGLVFLLPSACFAWNGEGHQLIAWVAEARLDEKTKVSIKELLGEASLSDADVVSWADQIRRDRRETGPWHYVNIPVDADGYVATRDGKNGNNVIDRAEHFSRVLADRTKPREERIEALKFVVHFVGDLHQPLHCAERNGDKGGNACLVFFPGQRKAINLHTVWDTFILRPRKGKQSVSEYGATLNEQISPEQANEWAQGTPEVWATEGWRIAKEKVYPPIPADDSVPTLTDRYVAEGGAVVDEQFQKAGVRLAEVLNKAFR